ncbi:MAG: hypothetical protein ABEN55_00475 [Bradymonadaceae bacterium]
MSEGDIAHPGIYGFQVYVPSVDAEGFTLVDVCLECFVRETPAGDFKDCLFREHYDRVCDFCNRTMAVAFDQMGTDENECPTGQDPNTIQRLAIAMLGHLDPERRVEVAHEVDGIEPTATLFRQVNSDE